MDKIGLPDAEAFDKFLRLTLSLPGVILNYIFEIFAAMGLDFPAAAKLGLLLILSTGMLVICYRHRTRFWSWPVGLYALLLVLATIFQIIVMIWVFLSSTRVSATGEVQIFKRTTTLSQEKVGGDWRSNDCGIDAVQEVQRCENQGKSLKPPFKVQIKSANCGSNVENVRLDPTSPSCLLIRERRTGCGYNKIFGIKDCRGRGWLDYDVYAESEKENMDLIETAELSGSFKARNPFSFEIPVPPGVDRSQVVFKYRIDVKQLDGSIVTLTDRSPSTDKFQTVISNNILRLSINTADQVEE